MKALAPSPSIRIQPWIFVLFLFLLIPLFISPTPMLGDFHNHLARLWLIGGGQDQLSGIYVIDWAKARLNIGIDLVAYLLQPLVRGDRVAIGLLATAIVLPPAACAYLNARALGASVWTFALPALAWTTTLFSCFLNFQLSIGLALLAAAIDGHVSPLWLRFLTRCLASFVLLLFHPFGLFFFGAMLVALAVGESLPSFLNSRDRIRSGIVDALSALGACLLPLAVITLSQSVVPWTNQDASSPPTVWTPLIGRFAALASPIRAYEIANDLIFAAAFCAVPVLALVTGRLRLHHGPRPWRPRRSQFYRCSCRPLWATPWHWSGGCR